ncbi:MAG: arginase family protein [Bacteroidales bacterium]|nr:arginase family protein [Bacteroidales bacterium]
MDLSSYFEPIDTSVVDYHHVEFHTLLGDCIRAHTAADGFPELGDARLAILGIGEGRGSMDNPGCGMAPDHVRHYLYRLARPHTDTDIVDLGNISRGATLRDTHFAVIEALHRLLEHGLTLIVLGGGDDLVFPIYKAYEVLGRVINICSVDSRFNLEGGDEVNSNNYLQHIILQQPNYLFDYVNMGYQSYFVGDEMVQLMDELKFTTHRVGEMQMNMDNAEPLVRYSDVVAVDISAVRQGDAPANANPSPHGFYGEQLCQIARFAGMSDKTSTFGIFEMDPAHDRKGQTAHMLAHAVWFFISGFYYRMGDFPYRDKQYYKRFTVELRDHGMDIVFYKSMKSDRWWMEVPCDDTERRERYLRHTLIPCNYSDYQRAMENEIPELWWHYYNRINS